MFSTIMIIIIFMNLVFKKTVVDDEKSIKFGKNNAVWMNLIHKIPKEQQRKKSDYKANSIEKIMKKNKFTVENFPKKTVLSLTNYLFHIYGT